MKYLVALALAAFVLTASPPRSAAQSEVSAEAEPVVAAEADAADVAADVYVWDIDKSHSAVTFTVRHFFTPVSGTFGDYDIELLFDPENLDESRINVTIAVNSVDTRNERRDQDLQSANFFEAETYPTITFTSSHIEAAGENEFVAHGELTIRDVTTDIALPFTLLGVMDMSAAQTERTGRKARAGFAAETSLDRHDYGVGSGNWAENTVVGANVDVSVTIEASRK
jgi:polyisoprenoid-binding protein YceI